MTRILFQLIFLSIIFFGCNYKPRAGGIENHLNIVASFEDLPHVKSIVDSIFDRAIYTPAPETYFDIPYVSPLDFNEIKRSHNLLVLSVIEIKDTTYER